MKIFNILLINVGKDGSVVLHCKWLDQCLVNAPLAQMGH